MAFDRIRELNAGLGFLEDADIDVCKIFGTNPEELNHLIQLENFPNFADKALFGVFGVDITLLDIRPNGNLVFLIKPPVSSKLHKHLFVLKIIFQNNYSGSLNMLSDDIIAEHVNSKIMLNLAKYKITPHAFGGIFTSPFINLNPKLKVNFSSFINKSSIKNKENAVKAVTYNNIVAGILQESFEINDDQYQIGNLHDIVDFKSINFYYILFQIMYTLAVFQKIGLKHNDLHTNNILVLQDIPAKTDTYTKYTLSDGKDYYLKNIGINSAIIDFGLSVKQPTPEANTVVMEHVKRADRSKSKTAKREMCFHPDLSGYKISDFLNVGEPNNDAMKYDDLYKLINELFVTEPSYKSRNTDHKSIIKKIFFTGEIKIDDFLQGIRGDPGVSFFHTSKHEYHKFTRFTNNYETILDNIFTHMSTLKDGQDFIVRFGVDSYNVIDSYNIKNISGESKTFKELVDPAEEFLNILRGFSKNSQAGGTSKKSRKSKKTNKNNKNNKTNKTTKNYK
jgi:hypothetical protein